MVVGYTLLLPYSLKIWRELNLVVWQSTFATAEKSANMYGDPLPNRQIQYFCNGDFGPNCQINSRQYFRLYGITLCTHN